MKLEHVEGQKKGKIILYSLSTCVWCMKTKRFLKDLGLDYYYVNVDQVAGEERAAVEREIEKWNPACSFPTLVFDDQSCIVGFHPDELKSRFQNEESCREGRV